MYGTYVCIYINTHVCIYIYIWHKRLNMYYYILLCIHVTYATYWFESKYIYVDMHIKQNIACSDSFLHLIKYAKYVQYFALFSTNSKSDVDMMFLVSQRHKAPWWPCLPWQRRLPQQSPVELRRYSFFCNNQGCGRPKLGTT